MPFKERTKNMKTLRPNQSGTFSNRVSVHNTEDVKLFIIEHVDTTSNPERLYLTELITCSADLLKALKKIINAVKEHPESKGLLNMQIKNAESIISDIEKCGSPYNY